MEFNKRRVGRTKLTITEFGLGGATLGGNVEGGVSAEAGRSIAAFAYDAGVRYFDTAPFYGYGRSEHAVGDELRERQGWVLSTKVGRLLKPRRKPQDADDAWQNPLPFEPVFDYSYDGAMRSYEDSLQRLGLNRIDILYLHDVDLYTHGPDLHPKMFRAGMEGAYKALDELRRNGDIKAIGLGVNEAKPIEDALDHGQWDVFLLAGRYTLLEQAPLHTMFPKLERQGGTVVIGGPFNSGVLVGRELWNYSKAPKEVLDRVKQIARVCDTHKVPLPAAALRFPLAHQSVSSIIPGPRSPDELKQIFAWWEHPIPAALWRDLKAEKLIDADAPVPA